MFDRGVVHLVGGYIVYHYYLRFDRGVVHVVVGYIVYHYCLRFDRGRFMLLWLLYCLSLLFKV
jgi:hypothetical protein